MNETTQKVRTRFAPSPTGFVHIGNFRTALFAFLFARHHGGVNILRIEDTDQNRFVEGAIENLLRVMKSMGVEFDEGATLDHNDQIIERGEFGPYLQSERLEIYHKHINDLVDRQLAYYCFCSPERLDNLRKEQVALKKPPMYDKLCRGLDNHQVEQKTAELKAQEKKPVVRMAIPEGGTTEVDDLVFGKITFENDKLDDQVILKSDGFPTYHLAVVVDDHAMEISHVLRGDDWMPSTPKHLLLYKAFGWQPPKFAHLPLIVNPDKTKLSKRQGDVAVEDFLQNGYLPQALNNFVALLGWNPKTEQEKFSLSELIDQFDLPKVNKAAPVFDQHKLDWLNGIYIRNLDNQELAFKLLPYWKQAGLIITSDTNYQTKNNQRLEPSFLAAVAALEKERLKKLSEISERTVYCFERPEFDYQLAVWRNSTPEQTKTILEQLRDFLSNLNADQLSVSDWETNIKQFISSNNYDNGSVLWPMRVALTGLDKSPGPFEVAAVLALGYGKQEVLERLDNCAKQI